MARLVARIYKEVRKLARIESNPINNKRASEINRQFLKDEIQLANKYKIKMFSFSRHLKMQIKTTKIPRHPSQKDSH